MTGYLTAGAMLCCAGAAFSASEAADEVAFARLVDLDRSHDRLDLEVARDDVLIALGDEGVVRVSGVPLPGAGTVSLDLERFSIVTPETRFVTRSGGGEERPSDVRFDDVVLLRGNTTEGTGSSTTLMLGETGIAGVLNVPGTGAFTIETGDVRQGEDEARTSIFRTSGVAHAPVRMCAEPIAVPAGHGAERGAEPPVPGTRIIEIAVETDYEYFELFETEQEAAEYVVLVYSIISEIFRRDLDVRLELTYVGLWDTPDDPFNATNPLGQFQTYWNQNMQHVHRDVAQFYSGRTDMPFGGVATLNSLCTESAYSVTGYVMGRLVDPLRPNYRTRDVRIAAHELGHNCGALHTHDVGLDRCIDPTTQAQRGTIMSYCGQSFSGGEGNVDDRFHTTIQRMIGPPMHVNPCLARDCNDNGIPDDEDLLYGASADVNGNEVPDECEDCNGNGVLDDSDIASLASEDLNLNGIPDECEPDCNANGLPDDVDLRGRDVSRTLFLDQFGEDTGWTSVGGGAGAWERGVPVENPMSPLAPPADWDGNGYCLLTGNSVDDPGVQSGSVSLISPALDLDIEEEREIRFACYVARSDPNDPEDRLIVEISADGAAGPWVSVPLLTTEGAWRVHRITETIMQDLGVPRSSETHVRITAIEGGEPGAIEAAIDAFRTIAIIETHGEDLNHNGILDECEPDLNGNGIVDYIEIQEDMSLDLDRDVALDAWEDCDENGTPDLVELNGANNVLVTGLDGIGVREFLALTGTLVRDADDAGIASAHDLIVVGDRYLVTSHTDDRIVAFALDGTSLGDFVPAGTSPLDGPNMMAIHPSGDLLVTSGETGAVLRYDIESGAYLGEFVAPGMLDAPYGLAFGPNGNLFVAGGAASGVVMEFDGTGGSFVRTFVESDTSGGLNHARGMVFLPSGDLLVVSHANDRVLRYDGATGAFVEQFNKGGTGSVLGLDSPWCVRTGPEGDVYVSRTNRFSLGATSGPDPDGGPQPLHFTNARIYQFDGVTGSLIRAYVQSLDSGILHPTGFDFIPDPGLDCNLNLVPDTCEIAAGLLPDVNANGIADTCESFCVADYNADGVVDSRDFFEFMTAFQQGQADIDGDGDTDSDDFHLFVGVYNEPGPECGSA